MSNTGNKFQVAKMHPEFGGNVYHLTFTSPDPTDDDIENAARALDDRVGYFGYRVLGRSGENVSIKIHTS